MDGKRRTRRLVAEGTGEEEEEEEEEEECCETWTLTLKEEQRLRMFENKMLRKIFGAKKDEVTEEWAMKPSIPGATLFFKVLAIVIIPLSLAGNMNIDDGGDGGGGGGGGDVGGGG
ncbi:hypothetical protein ANN_26742 [Periplaneta americana]|uniref:Uncharacterized protein n=1 Tax=Periplaneta americana TaxID=6978 RepID=A0ABQ8RYW4_PERAM|nr:hypothetical protein ANN_26742 [Periplaneta americana]